MTDRLRPRPRALAAALCVLAAALGGCGDEPAPRHGLDTPTLDSRPQGEAVTPRFEARGGDAWRGRIRMTMEVRQESMENGRPKEVKRSGSAVVEMTWRFRRTSDDAPPTSEITLRYVEAEGANADGYLARDTLTGTLEHDADGRVKPESLVVRGGLRDEQLQAHDLIGQLLLAGFGGSPPWTPPRPVRQGEAWALEDFLRPRALDTVRRYARDVGLDAPDPTFSGTARLAAVRADEAGDGPLLDLELQALIEIEGPIAHAGTRGRLSVGDRTEGRATVSARTGVPRSFEVTQTRRTDIRTAGDTVKALVTSRIHGEIERIAK